MTPGLWLALLAQLLQLAFFAGGAWAIVRQLRRDMNGLGAKVNRQQTDADRRFLTLAVLLLTMCGEEDRELLADRILETLHK